ncbi:pyrroloquinoline quinone biosynthesis peptide chaperone PqqD [Indioceanicola profundi]|uniref:pyrroloquinoline quinone biosynthesis peptide chaperone PqqD n=1 Tax=Indioceanicola profundi TaxID=2220096 RepID=UPI000E6AD8A2|nr:pyrroloquinoline quinone biosynthesis peptide chaperone PqqD [Indioceanicola profundi]
MAALVEDSRPRLPRHAKLRFDAARQGWVLLGPERVFNLDEIAAAVLQRCNGEETFSGIVGALAAEYEADPAEVAPDVRELLQDLMDKGMVTA